MELKGMHLSWIVVANIDSAIKFYTEVIGLSLMEFSAEYGWAELSGPDGARLGIAQYSESSEIEPGDNAVVTISVADIEKARNELLEKDVRLIGDILEVPGHVKMQTFADNDGNTFQLCQLL